jgi:hypothetical protein
MQAADQGQTNPLLALPNCYNEGSDRLEGVVTGIQFQTDKKGRKVSVRIDLRRHGALWEDFQDGLVAESRRKEKSVPLDRVKASLVKRGRLRG